MGRSNKGNLKTINEPFLVLRNTDAERDPGKGIVKKGHATTLHSLIRINRKFGDRISAVLQESAADRVINHANPLLLLVILLRSQHVCTGHFPSQSKYFNTCILH